MYNRLLKILKNLIKCIFELFGYELKIKISKLKSEDYKLGFLTNSLGPKAKNICVCAPNANAYSETFIRSHVLHLRGNTFFIHTGWTPTRNANGKRLSFLGLNNRKGIITFLKKNNINVVIAEYGPMGVGVMDICKSLNMRLIVVFHGFDASDNKIIDEYKEKYKELFFMPNVKIVGVSKEIVKNLIEMGCPDFKIYHISCGVDVREFDNEIQFWEKKNDFISVGRFVEKKAPYIVIMAFKVVLEKYPNSQLIMIGEGELLEPCRAIAAVLKVDKNIHFTGELSHLEVRQHIMNSKIFVQHSVIARTGDSEGTPVAILEAASCGLSIVSTFHGGIQDVIKNGENGFLVQEGDVDEMAKYMIQLLEDKELMKKFGNNARETILKDFSNESSINKLMEVVNSK